ncbi:MAG TPA: response regulator [Myxococcota bacterium]|nr:response regulator [Myxococcota bacterium]
MRGNVLVVDDQLRARRLLVTDLRDAGFEVCEAGNGAEGWDEFVRRRPDVVITDLVMPRADGLELLRRIRAQSETPVIVFTGFGTPQSAASAFKAGADDFVCSPDVEIDDLVALVADAISGKAPAEARPDLAHRFAGASRPLVRLRERLAGLAPLETPVLLAGEPGSGRDTAARSLHDFGATAGSEWVRLDPRAPLLERRATPPGAVYLDGIERFPDEARGVWSRHLAASEAEGFRRRPRVLASTSTPLAALAQSEEFSRGVGRVLLRFAIDLPPLRAVLDDLPEIAALHVARIGASVGRRIALSPAAQRFLMEQRWPGNVAQLVQVLERAISFSRGRRIRRAVVEEVCADLSESLDGIRARGAARERDELLRALQKTGGNITRTAEELCRSRPAVYRLIEKHGIALRRSP